MQKIALSLSLLAAGGLLFLSVGCTTGGGLTSSPVFPPSALDYSSQLSQLQARQGGTPYSPQGGFDNAPSRAPLFSRGSGSRSGSC